MVASNLICGGTERVTGFHDDREVKNDDNPRTSTLAGQHSENEDRIPLNA